MIGERQHAERLGLEEQSSTTMQEPTDTADINMETVDGNRIADSSASSSGETDTPAAINADNYNSTAAEPEESPTVETLLASDARNSVSPVNTHGRNDTPDNSNNNHDDSATRDSSASSSSSTSSIPQQPHPTTNPQNHQLNQHRRQRQPYTRTFNLHPLQSMFCTLLFQPLLNLIASFYTLTAYCFSFWTNFLFAQVLPTQQRLYCLSIVLLGTHFVSVEWNKRDVASLLLPPPPPSSSSSTRYHGGNNNNRYVVMSYHDYNTDSLGYYYSWDNDDDDDEEEEGALLHMTHSGVPNRKDSSTTGRANVAVGPAGPGGGGRHEMEAMILVRYLLPPLVLLLGTLTLLLSVYLFVTIVSSPSSSPSAASTSRLSNYRHSSRNDRNIGDGDGDDTRAGPDEPVLVAPPPPSPPPPLRTFAETESPPAAYPSSPSLLAAGIGTLLLMESVLPLCIYMYGTYLWFAGVVPLSMGVGVMALLWLITFVGTGWMRSVLYRNMGHG